MKLFLDSSPKADGDRARLAPGRRRFVANGVDHRAAGGFANELRQILLGLGLSESVKVD